MKKFLIISAAVLFTAVTVLSIVFGVLYFKEKDKNKPSGDMSISQASALTNTICLNLGLVKPASSSSVKAMSLPADEEAYYEDATANKLTETKQKAVKPFAESILLADAITKIAAAQNTYYADTFTHNEITYNVFYTYKINGRSFVLNAIFANDKTTHKAQQINVVLAYTDASEKAWSVEASAFDPNANWTYSETYKTLYYDPFGGTEYLKVTGTTEKVNEVEYIEFKAAENAFTSNEATVVAANVADVITYYANFNTMKRYELKKSDSGILDEDALNLANETHLKIKALSDSGKLDSFINMKEAKTLGVVLTTELAKYEA